MINNEQLKELSNDVAAFYGALRDWKDAVYYHRQAIAAAAMAAEIIYFNAVKAYGVTNFDRPNEVPFPFIITEIGLDLDGDPDDMQVIRRDTEIIITKDNRAYRAIPSSSVPSGGGLAMSVSDPTAATLHEYATVGVDARMYQLPVPIAVTPQQNFNVILSTAGSTPGAIIGTKILLRGLVSRTVI